MRSWGSLAAEGFVFAPAKLPDRNSPLSFKAETDCCFAFVTERKFVCYAMTPQTLELQSLFYVCETQDKTSEWHINEKFGGRDVREMDHVPGTAFSDVWRPGYRLYDYQLTSDDLVSKLNLARGLALLLRQLDEIFDFVEPEGKGLDAYGHEIRKLLILACTEVEDYFRLETMCSLRTLCT